MLQKRPWLWIVFGFVILIAAWSVLITIAVKNQPEKIPVKTATETAAPGEQKSSN